MKIKCIKIYNEHTKQEEQTSPFLTVGGEYIVLAIEMRVNRVHYLLLDDSSTTPGLQLADQFEVMSKTVPATWKIFPGFLELLVLEPEAWQTVGFWDNYYDGDPKAREIFRREAKIIYQEEGVAFPED